MYKMINMGKVRLLNVVAEAALIVFSILLALYTNRWREDRAAHQRVDRDLTAIHIELQQNRALVADVLPYQEQEVENFGKFLARPDIERIVHGKNMFQVIHDNREELAFHGIWHPHVTPSTLSDTAWKTAVANGDLPLINPDLVKSLIDYYSFQETGLMSDISTTGQLYMSPPPYDRNQTLAMLYTIQGTFTQLADHGTSLLHQADETLEMMPNK